MKIQIEELREKVGQILEPKFGKEGADAILDCFL